MFPIAIAGCHSWGRPFSWLKQGMQSGCLTTPSCVQEGALSELFHTHFLNAKKTLVTMQMYLAAHCSPKRCGKVHKLKKEEKIALNSMQNV